MAKHEEATVELDICWEDYASLEEACDESVKRYGLKSWKVVDPAGPGGGWPVVEFTGTDAAVDLAYTAYTDPQWSDEKYPLPA